MKAATLTLLIFFVRINANAMEGVTDGKCYIGTMIQYIITRKLDAKHFEMFSKIDGNHAILETSGKIIYGPGLLPGVPIKHLGSKVAKLENGFDGQIEIWKECTPKDSGAIEAVQQFYYRMPVTKNEPENKNSKIKSEPIKESELNTEFNNCNNKCYDDFSEDKLKANQCYSTCKEKSSTN